MVIGPHVYPQADETTDVTQDGGEEKRHLQAAVRNQALWSGGKGSWGNGVLLN